MLYWLKNLPWRDIFILGVLLIFEVAMHPLTLGPDRRIHDPAVYRLSDVTYLPGDWYTDMAVESGVYTFYAALIHFGPTIGISEELWRQIVYIACLIVLYWSLIKIATLFTKNFLVVPLVALLHAGLILYYPPSWLYGPFIHIDGGLAPRSVGVALSFLSLFFLLRGAPSLPWILLGLATLVHVSNSFIVFVLFLGASLFKIWWVTVGKHNRAFWRRLFWECVRATTFYLFSGGWFVFLVALQGNMEAVTFSTEKFIWTWVYLRAPYMALPLTRWEMWLVFGLHIATLLWGWYWLRARVDETKKNTLDLLGLVGMGGVGLFFLFYFFTFIVPWLPGFQFYSLRAIYITHFVTYLFIALGCIFLVQRLHKESFKKILLGVIVAGSITFLGFADEGRYQLRRAELNLRYTWIRLQDIGNPVAPPSPDQVVARYLFLHREPFLAPPTWLPSPMYLPHIVSLKTFGFTPKGLEEWYSRLNAVSQGELDRIYQAQMTSDNLQPVKIDWETIYHKLSSETVRELSQRYHFQLFVAQKNKTYPFEIITEDKEYRLYQVYVP